MDDPVFPLDIMRSLGKQLARWFLSQNVLLSVCSSEEVGRVRLAEAELYAC